MSQNELKNHKKEVIDFGFALCKKQNKNNSKNQWDSEQ